MATDRWGIVQDLVVDLGSVCASLEVAETAAEGTTGGSAQVLAAASSAKQDAASAVSRAAGAEGGCDFDATVTAARESIAKARETIEHARLIIATA